MLQKIKVTDFAGVKTLHGISLSPDGKKAAFVVRQADVEKDCYQKHIWVWEDKGAWRLTGGGKEGGFVWLDGETILFPGDRQDAYKDKGPCTVFNRISIRGGEAEEYFAVPFEAGLPTPVGDGRFLLLGTYDPNRFCRDAKTGELREKTKEELEEDKRYEVFDELPFWKNGQGVTNKKRSRLYLCGPGGETTAFTPPLMQVWFYVYCKDRQEILVVGDEYSDKSGQKPGVYLYKLDGSCRELYAQGRMDVDAAGFMGEDFFLAASDGKRYGTSQNVTFYRLGRDGSLSVLADLDISLAAAWSPTAEAAGRAL